MPATVPSGCGGTPSRLGGSERETKTATAAARAAVTSNSFFTSLTLQTSDFVFRTSDFILQTSNGCRRLERRCLIGALPRELGLGAAEMAERSRLLVDGPAQVELFHDAARRQLELLSHQLGDLLFRNPAGALCVDHDRHRIGDADRVRELHERPFRDAGRDDVLRDVARHVAGRSIDFRRILARERTAAVWRRAAVGVDDDLASGDAGVAVRAAD